jgi:transcriptional regulator GlxA family with amidase domain
MGRVGTERTPSGDGHKKVDSVLTSTSQSPASERHHSVADVASMWNLSEDTVRRMFQNEPGVLVLGGHSCSRKRRYATLRIPQSVLERVHRQYELGY